MDFTASRIEQIARYEGISVGELERTIGAGKGVISRAIKNGTDIQAKWLQLIVEIYPNYSPEWLLTGRGPMLRTARSPAGDGLTFEEARYLRLQDTLYYALTAIGSLDTVANAIGIDPSLLSQYTNAGADAETRAAVERTLDALFDAFPELSPFRVLAGNPDDLSEITVKRPVPAARKADADIRDLRNRLERAENQMRSLFDMLKAKDEQLKAKDEQINNLFALLKGKE